MFNKSKNTFVVNPTDIENLIDLFAKDDADSISTFNSPDMNYHELKALMVGRVMKDFTSNTNQDPTAFTQTVIATITYLAMHNFVLMYKLIEMEKQNG